MFLPSHDLGESFTSIQTISFAFISRHSPTKVNLICGLGLQLFAGMEHVMLADLFQRSSGLALQIEKNNIVRSKPI